MNKPFMTVDEPGEERMACCKACEKWGFVREMIPIWSNGDKDYFCKECKTQVFTDLMSFFDEMKNKENPK